MNETDTRKAAILLMTLSDDEAGLVMSKLSPKQVEAVSIEIAKLGRIQSEEQENVIYDFAHANPNNLGLETGGIDRAKSLVEKALGKNASTTLDNVCESIEALPFSFLKTVDSQNLLTFIVDEHPQTIALILSHLHPSYGAEVLAGLPGDTQTSVIRRIANMSQTSPDVIEEVERGLESRMQSVMNESFESAGGVSSVAEILNVSERATERTLLENLAQEDPTLVEDIRRLMFVFEDITKLLDKDIQAVLKNVETTQWAMALKGASDELRQKVLGNMSQRASDMLIEEMEFLGPVRLSDVESVQQQIVDILRRLEDSGEINLATPDEAEEFIE
ncbi:MAG: flagellar motor switch protein FliG [Pirellulaceae bacterium]|nr:flagellar motor switch protein FliG [Pirellulaceae bacterium]